MPLLPGYRVWESLTPVTVAASPLLSPWIDTTGFTNVLPSLAVAGGTTVVTIEFGTDAVNADADFTVATITPGMPAAVVPVSGPYMRCRVVQTVADASKTKIFLQARA